MKGYTQNKVLVQLLFSEEGACGYSHSPDCLHLFWIGEVAILHPPFAPI